jgi:hypothetical protein
MAREAAARAARIPLTLRADKPDGANPAMKLPKIGTFLFLCGLAMPLFAQEYEWQPANEETAQLDPAEFHAGRVYRPGPDGGNMHVDIAAQQPVTIEMVRTEDWDAAMQHPEAPLNVEFRCVREHVKKTTFECHLPPNTPMTLLVRDERNLDRAVFAGIGSILAGKNGVRHLASPNGLHIQYYRWACIANCNPPVFQWFRQVKEKYELTPVLKVYGGYAPSGDGEQVSIKIKSPAPMAVALLPPQEANQLYANPSSFESVFAGAACKQRGIQSLTFQCTLNAADGPQALVVAPEPGGKVPHKKAEVEFYAYKCVENCPAGVPK